MRRKIERRVYICPDEGVIMDVGWPECPICGHVFNDADIYDASLTKFV